MHLTDKHLDNFWAKIDVHLEDECWWWAGNRNPDGYGMLYVSKGYSPTGHRVMYELMVEPILAGNQIDHICHNPSCVNPKHLRQCTPSENRRNAKLCRDSSSGLKGASWDKESGKWKASAMGNDGKLKNLGRCLTAQEAHEAYCHFTTEHYGEFANHGRVAQTNKEAYEGNR